MASEAGRAAVYKLSEVLLRGSGSRTAAQLASALTHLEDAALRQGVLDALAGCQDPAGQDAVWEVWAQTRQADLTAFLKESGWPALAPRRVQVLGALLQARLDELAGAPLELVEPLLDAAQDQDPVLSERARSVLLTLRDPAAQEELCRWVIERDHPVALQAALQAGYQPRDPQRRALFFLLTGQWERYELLDFDASLLRAVYETGPQELRSRIAALARQAGWAGYVEALAGRQNRRLEEISAIEWEVVLTLLGRSQRWDEIWRLAQAAPAVWSARLLQALARAGWRPPEADEDPGYDHLLNLAAASLEQGLPLDRLARLQAVLWGHNRLVSSLAFSPDGQILASGSADKSVRLWRLPEGELERILEGHSHYILCLAVSPDGQILASGSADKSIRLWRLPEGEPAGVFGGHAREVKSLAFHPHGHFLASGDAVTARLWEMPAGRLVAILPEHEEGVDSLGFTPQGDLLASAAGDHSLRLWRLPEGELHRAIQDKVLSWAFWPGPPAGEHEPGLRLVTGAPYGRLRLWQLPDAALSETLEGAVDARHLAVSPTGQHLAASQGKDIRLWTASAADGGGSTEPQVRLLSGHARPVSALVFSPDGQLLASGGEDEELHLWRPSDGARLRTLTGFGGPVRQVLFAPDGQTLAAAGSESIRLILLEDLRPLFQAAAASLTAERLEWAEKTLPAAGASEVELAWLEFTQALFRWRRRFDIALAEAPHVIQLGEFDIEISG